MCYGLETDKLKTTHLSCSLLLPGCHGPNLPQFQLLPSEARLMKIRQCQSRLGSGQIKWSQVTWLVRVGPKVMVVLSLVPSVFLYLRGYADH